MKNTPVVRQPYGGESATGKGTITLRAPRDCLVQRCATKRQLQSVPQDTTVFPVPQGHRFQVAAPDRDMEAMTSTHGIPMYSYPPTNRHLFPKVFPLLRLSPTPADDYNFNLDDNEGVCDLFDVQILNY
ncbi:Transcription factor E2F5 [Manis javanica]|nr:Transcription factor E2F5 [Manis javanica]